MKIEQRGKKENIDFRYLCKIKYRGNKASIKSCIENWKEKGILKAK